MMSLSFPSSTTYIFSTELISASPDSRPRERTPVTAHTATPELAALGSPAKGHAKLTRTWPRSQHHNSVKIQQEIITDTFLPLQSLQTIHILIHREKLVPQFSNYFVGK